MLRVTSHFTNLAEREEREGVERAWWCIGEPGETARQAHGQSLCSI